MRFCSAPLLILAIASTTACQIAEGASLPSKANVSQADGRLAGALVSGAKTAANSDKHSSAPKAGAQAKQLGEPKRSAASCPEGMAEFGGYCVDRYEAHLVVRQANGKVTAHPPHDRPASGVRYEARSTAGVLPQAYISREESKAACENAGKRLCSVVEWYGACQGGEKTTFPYGAKFERKTCNVSKAHLLSRYYGSNSRNWQYKEHFNNPMLNQVPGFLAKTGEYERCTNDSGTFDMVGNLHEWVADKVDASLASKLPLKPGIRRALTRTRGHGIFMGGFFSTTHEHGKGCNFVTIGHEPRYHDYSTGFRCCADLSSSAP